MTQKNAEVSPDRRPLASRQYAWAHQFSTQLANAGITPNQISFVSVVFALLALVFLILPQGSSKWLPASSYIAAAVACQLRLLCNLMDGMVAVEAGKQTADGALWNEFPDRLADLIILMGVGIAAGQITLAWAVVAMAMFVAYVRELGKGIDGVSDYSGPMAKPHRMALMTGALILCAIVTMLPTESIAWLQPSSLLSLSLWVCGGGCAITIWRRVVHLQRRLNAKST